jgi:hypothetical protein
MPRFSFLEIKMLTKLIIIVTFAISSTQSNDPANYTKTQYGTRIHSQAIMDTQGRLVWFDDIQTCEQVAADILQRMQKDINIIPQHAKCVSASVDMQPTQK